jgi:xylose isomerase
MRDQRYSGWEGDLGRAITDGTATLAELADRVEQGEIDPDPVSGRQELYENVVSDALWG